MKLNWRYFVKMASQLVRSEFFRTTQGRVIRKGKVVKVRTKKGKVWVTLVHKSRRYVYLFQTRDTWAFLGASGNIILKRKRAKETLTSCRFSLADPFPVERRRGEENQVRFEKVHGY